MEHLDSPYFVSAEAQDYVTLHADILDNTADPLPQMQTNAALTLSNHKSNTPMFVLANSIGKHKKTLIVASQQHSTNPQYGTNLQSLVPRPIYTMLSAKVTPSNFQKQK